MDEDLRSLRIILDPGCTCFCPSESRFLDLEEGEGGWLVERDKREGCYRTVSCRGCLSPQQREEGELFRKQQGSSGPGMTSDGVPQRTTTLVVQRMVLVLGLREHTQSNRFLAVVVHT